MSASKAKSTMARAEMTALLRSTNGYFPLNLVHCICCGNKFSIISGTIQFFSPGSDERT